MPPVRNIQASQRPWPHPARPGGVDAALDEGGDREGKADREADIAEIEQRRMDGEAEILQHRVEIAALDRRRIEPDERIGRRQDEQEEGGADGALHGQHIGSQRRRKVGAEDGDQRAEEGQDQHPEQHRAFVIAPGSGDLVDQRLQRMRVLPDARHREIGACIGDCQRRERERGERKAGHRDRTADRHHLLVAGARADTAAPASAPATVRRPGRARNVRFQP